MALVPGGYYLSPFKSGEKAESRTGKAVDSASISKRTEGVSQLSDRRWVDPFQLDVRPVSTAEYLAFVKRSSRWQRSKVKRLFADANYLVAWKGDVDPPPERLAKPVTQVSWYAAKEYCREQGKRLPSTAEWERAALQMPKGMDSAAYAAQILEWYSRPAAPGGLSGDTSGSRNAFGIRDLFGKVWEWTSDFNASGPTDRGEGSAKDGSFFCGGAGAAATPGTDYATFMRYAFRSSLKPEFSLGALGFRCAKDSR